MSIEQIQETLIIQQTEEILKQQQKIIQKSETIEKIKDLLGLVEDNEEIYFDEVTPGIHDSSWEYIYWGKLFEDMKKDFPRLYSSIKRTSDNVLPILQTFEAKNEKRLEELEKSTQRNRKKLFSILWSIARENSTETKEEWVINLANAMIHSPNQSFFYARKKAIEMEELTKKKIEEPEAIFRNIPDNFPKQREKIIERNLEDFGTIYVPEMFSFTKCEIFYYEEDYYDCVNGHTLLIDIRDKHIKFGHGMEVRKKEELIKEERIGNIALRYPDFDYYFLYEHKRFWLQCIGWLSIHKWWSTTMTIYNHNDGLRYGTKYINENNREYRSWSCTEDGDVHPELISKDTAEFINIIYKMLKEL